MLSGRVGTCEHGIRLRRSTSTAVETRERGVVAVLGGTVVVGLSFDMECHEQSNPSKRTAYARASLRHYACSWADAVPIKHG